MFEPLTPYQIVLPIIACVMVLYAWHHVFRGTKTIWEALLWTAFWCGLALIAAFPLIRAQLTVWTGIRDQENAIFAIAIGILLFIVFHLVISMEHINKRITDLARYQALKNAGLIDGSVKTAKRSSDTLADTDEQKAMF